MTKYNHINCGFAEKDKYAARAYSLIHSVSPLLNWGDITKIEINDFVRMFFGIEFLFCGSPCTDFSVSGLQKNISWKCRCGHSYNPLEIAHTKRLCCPECGATEDIAKTESSLVVYYLEILRRVQPKITMFENVASLVNSKKFKPTFELIKKEIEDCGYNVYYKTMNCKDYTKIPQNRDRLMLVAIRNDIDTQKFKFPDPVSETLPVSALLEDCTNVFYRYPDSRIVIDQSIPLYVRCNIEREAENIVNFEKGIYRPRCTSGFQDNQVGVRYIPTLRAKNPTTIALQIFETDEGTKYYIKKLSPKEKFYYMGFTDEDYSKVRTVSRNQLSKAAGNSIVVDLVEAIFQEIFNCMPELFENARTFHLFSGIGSYEKGIRNVIDKANSENNE